MYLIKKLSLVAIVFGLLFTCSQEDEPSAGQIVLPRNFQGLMNDYVNGKPVVIYADQGKGIFSVFSRVFDGKELTFKMSTTTFPIKLLDSNGIEWDIFGLGRSPSNIGQQLTPVNHIVGYWFFFPSFFEDITLTTGEVIRGDAQALQEEEWLINTGNIQHGSFRDGIRSIDHPSFMKFDGKNIIDNEFYVSLDNDELMTVTEIEGGYKVYPHRILEYHEIVNDIHDTQCYTISYCPLTGTSRMWKSKVNGAITEFGVSGLLYNNNLILYDRSTESHWSQILNISVNGSKMGQQAVTKGLVEMKYGEVSKLDGDVFLLDPASGSFSSYTISQYEYYKDSEQIFFPLARQDQSIPPKERVLGVTVGDITKVYRFEDFGPK